MQLKAIGVTALIVVVVIIAVNVIKPMLPAGLRRWLS